MKAKQLTCGGVSVTSFSKLANLKPNAKRTLFAVHLSAAEARELVAIMERGLARLPGEPAIGGTTKVAGATKVRLHLILRNSRTRLFVPKVE